jgi:hypothetical protein
MYNFYMCLVKVCLYLDFVVFTSENHVVAVGHCLQTSLRRLMTWFGDQGLSSFIVCKQVRNDGFFSRKHENHQVSVRLGRQTALQNVTEFKYLRIFFDRKLTWWLHAEYIQQRLIIWG